SISSSMLPLRQKDFAAGDAPFFSICHFQQEVAFLIQIPEAPLENLMRQAHQDLLPQSRRMPKPSPPDRLKAVFHPTADPGKEMARKGLEQVLRRDRCGP